MQESGVANMAKTKLSENLRKLQVLHPFKTLLKSVLNVSMKGKIVQVVKNEIHH